jgi:hypothetical protein
VRTSASRIVQLPSQACRITSDLLTESIHTATSRQNMTDNRLRVGIIGAGEVAQVIHLPALAMLSHLYITTAVCDILKKVGLAQTIMTDHHLTPPRTQTTAPPNSTYHLPPQTPKTSSQAKTSMSSSTSPRTSFMSRTPLLHCAPASTS